MTRPTAARPRSRENTREALLESAVDVFVEKGLKRVTVDDLVGAAGFTRGAFYSNFSSVDEVFFEVFGRGAREMLAHARACIAAVPEGEFTLDTLGQLLDAISSPGRPWLVLHSEFTLLALRDARAREVLAEFSAQLRGDVVDVLADVLARLDRRPTVPLEQLAEVVVALQLDAMTKAVLEGRCSADGAVAGLGEGIAVAILNGASEQAPATGAPGA